MALSTSLPATLRACFTGVLGGVPPGGVPSPGGLLRASPSLPAVLAESPGNGLPSAAAGQTSAGAIVPCSSLLPVLLSSSGCEAWLPARQASQMWKAKAAMMSRKAELGAGRGRGCRQQTVSRVHYRAAPRAASWPRTVHSTPSSPQPVCKQTRALHRRHMDGARCSPRQAGKLGSRQPASACTSQPHAALTTQQRATGAGKPAGAHLAT